MRDYEYRNTRFHYRAYLHINTYFDYYADKGIIIIYISAHIYFTVIYVFSALANFDKFCK